MKTNIYDVTKSCIKKQFTDITGNVLNIGDVVAIANEFLEIKVIYYISNKYVYVANIDSNKTFGSEEISNPEKYLLCINDLYTKNNLNLPHIKYVKNLKKYLFIIHNKIENTFMIVLLNPKYNAIEYINEMLMKIFYQYSIDTENISIYIAYKGFSYYINKITKHTAEYNHITTGNKYNLFENKLYLIDQINDKQMILKEYNTQNLYLIQKPFIKIPISIIYNFIHFKN